MTPPPGSGRPAPDGGDVGAWGPLRQPLYRSLWLAALVSNLGTWMHEAAGAWMMTKLWAEHLRQHEGMTMSDREVQAIVRSFHVGPDAPAVRHLLAAQPAGE